MPPPSQFDELLKRTPGVGSGFVRLRTEPAKESVGKINSVLLCAISVSLWLIFSE